MEDDDCDDAYADAWENKDAKDDTRWNNADKNTNDTVEGYLAETVNELIPPIQSQNEVDFPNIDMWKRMK